MYLFKETDQIYDWISCLNDKIYFGPFPNQLMIDRLEEEKFDLIVNLTQDDESLFSHKNNTEIYKISKKKYIDFPIKDNGTPECSLAYCHFIMRLKHEYNNGRKIYIHCRGGHGRSSMVCVSLLSYIFQNDLKKSIEIVNNAHLQRVILRNRWKSKQSPFNYNQYLFLLKIHKYIYINMNSYNKYYNWLFYKEPIVYQNFTFRNIYELFLYELIDETEKYKICYDFFMTKFKDHKELECRLQLTYLKTFLLVDCEDKKFCDTYQSVLSTIRENLYDL